MGKTALILSTGGSPEPLIKCILNYKPNIVYFLHSNESLSMAYDVLKSAEFNGEYYFRLVNDSEDLQDSYVKSRDIIKELHKENYEVLVDFTGGTKPMVAGLVLAAIGENCNYSYVGTSSKEGRSKNGVGIVKNGFEVIKSLNNPYETFAVTEINKTKQFFNTYQFTAAKENIKIAQEKIDDDLLLEVTDIYSNLITLYDKWDKFAEKIGKNKRTLNNYLNNFILKKINSNEDIRKIINEENPNLLIQLNKNMEFLEKKLSKEIKINERIYYYLPDLLNNAYRRMEEGKYDDAIARLYRVNELFAQIGLNKFELFDEKILSEQLKFHISRKNFMDVVGNNYDIKDKVMEWTNDYNNYSKTFTLPSYKSFELLNLLESQYDVEDKIADYYFEKDINGKIKDRNNSILAHGLKAMKQKKSENLYDLVLNFAKKLNPNIEEDMELAKFPKLSE